jgi:transcriptional regulator with XRE-family HTH domain
VLDLGRRVGREDARVGGSGVPARERLTRMTISEIERGLNTHPRWGTIHRLARAFGVPPEKLMIPAP